MKFKVGDKVQAISGASNGKQGTILRIVGEKIVVEGMNLKTKYTKKTAQQAGSMIKKEFPFDASNAMLVCPKTGKVSRVGYELSEKGKKYRVAKVSGEKIDKTFKRS